MGNLGNSVAGITQIIADRKRFNYRETETVRYNAKPIEIGLVFIAAAQRL